MPNVTHARPKRSLAGSNPKSRAASSKSFLQRAAEASGILIAALTGADGRSLKVCGAPGLRPCGHFVAPAPLPPAPLSGLTYPDGAFAPGPQGHVMTLPLTGCPQATWNTELNVGNGSVTLTLDSGSSDLAIVTNYTPGLGSIDTHEQVNISYGSSAYSGSVVLDTVRWGQMDAFRSTFLKATSAEESSFEPSCIDDALVNPWNDGILGLGRDAIAMVPGLNQAADGSDGGTSFLTQMSRSLGLPNRFATRLCEQGGSIFVGGYDSASIEGKFTYVPLYDTLGWGGHFEVATLDVLFDNKSLINADVVGGSEFIASIVDSGTNGILLPSSMMQALTQALAPYLSKLFVAPHNSTAQGRYEARDPDATDASINAALPQLQFVMQSADGNYTLDVQPTQYLLPVHVNGSRLYKSALGSSNGLQSSVRLSEPLIMLGSPAQTRHVIMYDIDAAHVGFAAANAESC